MISCPNEQVKLFNDVLLNIYSNFIPNQIRTINPRQAPWITHAIRKYLRKKSHAYKNLVKNGGPASKFEGIQKMVSDGAKMINEAKQNYFRKTGESLANPRTTSKTYWSLLNAVLNKAKTPIIPALLENGVFITDFSEKAQLFDDHFVLQCTEINIGIEIPRDETTVHYTLINDVAISEEKILAILRSLNPNKAHG